MESYFVVSAQNLTDDDLRPLVTQRGGHWPPDREFGVVQDRQARIEIYTSGLMDYSPGELGLIEGFLRAPPTSGVSVAYRSNDESECWPNSSVMR